MLHHKKDFFDFVQALNIEQQQAITPKDGKFLVIAGAGSGKTRVITARIAHLVLEHQIDPTSIIALTFTNKAAGEMQHRIEQFLPHLSHRPTVATFHAYCLRLLKTHRHTTGQATFSILDAADQQKLLQAIIKEKNIGSIFNIKNITSQFSAYKLSNLLDLDLELTIPSYHLSKFTDLYHAYEAQKQLHNYLDFDDLLYKTYQLFHTNAAFAQQHQQHYRHILVDEYQDTNVIQHALLKKMSLNTAGFALDSLCVVGDEDQSIYSWRGATVHNILNFNKEFPGAQLIKLEQNYRSSQRILDIANNVIKHNTQRNHKKLWSDRTQSHTPLQLECISDQQEAYILAQSLKLARSKKQPLSSIAILYRTHYQSRIIEETLIKEAIPYVIIGGIQFYERKEIKDLIAYLRLAANPFDILSLQRVINCPLRGLGEKFEELFFETWKKNQPASFVNIATLLIETKALSAKQANTLTNFISLFTDLDGQTPPWQALDTIIKKTDYLTYLQDNFEQTEAQTKKENVLEFLRAAQHAQHVRKITLSAFLEDIGLMQELIKEKNLDDSVQMMTLHSAKGLEFETVYLCGLEDGILPSNQAIESSNIEEERRLFYVGLTRAKQSLLLTHSKYRNTFGQTVIQRPSRFLDEIPTRLLRIEDAKQWSSSQCIKMLHNWMYTPTASTLQSSVAPKITTLQPDTPTTQTATVTNTIFKRLQSVKHQVFGVGIVQTVENKGTKTFVTVHFSHYGTKKIDGSFLTKL